MIKKVSFDITHNKNLEDVYRCRNYYRLNIYYGDKILTEYYTHEYLPKLSKSELKKIVIRILELMGYKVLLTGRLVVKDMAFDKVKFENNVSKNIAPKSENFLNKWNVLLDYLVHIYGLTEIISIKEEDKNTFKVKVKDYSAKGWLSNPKMFVYKISKRPPASNIHSNLYKGYYIWM